MKGSGGGPRPPLQVRWAGRNGLLIEVGTGEVGTGRALGPSQLGASELGAGRALGPRELGPSQLGTGEVAPREVGLGRALGASEEVAALYAQLRRRSAAGDLPGVLDIVPGATTVLVTAQPGTGVLADLAASLADWPLEPAPPPPAGTVELPVTYDGEDLDAVAGTAGLSRDEVIELHTAATYRVAFCGFAPGFAYLEGVPEPLRVPRLAHPRPAVPAGAVGLAAGYCGVYPRSSPGGWQLIGRTTVVVFDPGRDPPALLTPGTLVRFTAQTRRRQPVPGAPR